MMYKRIVLLEDLDMFDVEIGQKREWFQSRRVFTVESKIDGTAFYVCRYEDGTEEHHDSFIINCKSYVM